MEREQLEKMTLEGLRTLARERGLPEAGELSRSQLIDRLAGPGESTGRVPLLDRGAPALIAELARDAKFKGVRPMLQDLPDDDWIANPALVPPTPPPRA